MKKRILSALLCMMMILPLLLSSCSSGEEDDAPETNAVISTETLVMYMIKEPGTTDEAAQAVEDAINRITKSKFKIQLEIRLFTEDEYYQKLEEAILASKQVYDDIRANTPIETEAPDDAEQTEEETILNQYGLPELKYPTADPNQVDIFFLGGLDTYMEYIENEWLQSLDEQLTTDAKKLNDFIYPSFMEAVEIDNTTYAIPNNNVIGEYTYLLLNKELMSKYYYNPDDISSLHDARDFLDDVKAYEPDYDPLAYDSIKDPTLVHYWNIDADTLTNNSNSFSLIGSTYGSNSTIGTYLTFSSLFTRPVYKNQLLALKYYETSNYYASENSTKKYAASVIKGGAELMDEYADEFYVNVIDYPRATNEQLYYGMFGVNSYSLVSLTRSMEIITYLNTNADFRNLFQYGIENINYSIEEDGSIRRIDNNGYYMDLAKTGNVFIAYPEEGMSLDAWKYGKIQNLDSKQNFMLGFSFLSEQDDINVDAIRRISAESLKIQNELNAITDYDAYAAKLEEYTTLYRASSNVALSLSKYTMPNNESEGEKQYPITIYYNWLVSEGYIIEE